MCVYGYMCTCMKDREVEVPHHFFLITFKFNKYERKGTIGKEEENEKMEIGFVRQINFQGSGFSPYKVSRSVHFVTNFSFTVFPVSSSLNLKTVAEGETEAVEGRICIQN